MANSKILIVDDEDDLREALATALTAAGFEVKEARNGEEGVKLALAEKPNLILMDIMMPKMTGHEALGYLRQDPWGKTVPVILLTAQEDPENVVAGVQAGSDDYIMKTTTSLNEVVKKVTQYAAGYRK